MNFFNTVSLFFISNVILWPFKISIHTFSLRLNIFVIFFIFLLSLLKNVIAVKSLRINTILLILLLAITAPIISFVGPCENGHIKSILSLPLFLILIISSLEISRRASIEDWLSLESASIFCILISILSIFFEIIAPQYFPAQYVYRLGGIYSGLFDEPSHLGFSLFPCFLIVLISNNSLIRRIGLFSLVLCIYLSPSSTLLLESIAIFFLILIKDRNFSYFFPVIISALTIHYTGILGHSPTDLIDKISQIYPPTINSNMSSLVYLQGWQDAYTNLTSSSGLGLGFNMMGCDPLPKTETRLILEENFNAAKLNSQDGSFLLAKGISEFGIFFILFVIFSVVILIKIYKNYRLIIDYNLKRVSTIWGILIFSSLFTMCVRSSSYFTGNFPILILVLFAFLDSSFFNKKIKKSDRK